uniref:hypothetical protein n=1 Tax=Flavobacterium sp. TaxID=239 RepID=UPI00404AE4B5
MKIEDIYNTYFENLNSIQAYFNKFESVANKEDSDIINDKEIKIKEIINDFVLNEVSKNGNLEEEQELSESAEISLDDLEKIEGFDEFIKELSEEVNYRLRS